MTEDIAINVVMPPFQVFEKALIKAMLKKRRLFVIREEITEQLPDNLPPNFQDPVSSLVDISEYLFTTYHWDNRYDIITLPEILQPFNSVEKDVFEHVIDSMVLGLNLDVFNRFVLEYMNYTKFIHYNDWVHLLLNKAAKYFRIVDRHDAENPDYNRREVFDGEELVASIRYHRESGEYFFYSISASGEDIDASH